MRVGILGGGQLARMMALAGRPIGLESVVIDPGDAQPTRGLVESHRLDWDDDRVLTALDDCDVVTYEFENVPVELARSLAQRKPVHPEPEVLAHTQDRLHEKALLAEHGIPVPNHAAVDSWDDLVAAIERIGLPAILKTRRMGYDGRGQRMIRNEVDAKRAFEEIGGVALILEQCIGFEREVSVIAVRSRAGEIRFWSTAENRHLDGILRISRIPASCSSGEVERGRAWVAALMEATGYVGVMAVEFFVCADGWIANEIACRVHNSGHWTDFGAMTSQFENHMRAIAGLPLGSTEDRGVSAMVNLIGKAPPLEAMLAVPAAHVHLYDKTPAPMRKLGHVTLVADDAATLEGALVEVVRAVGDPATTEALDAERSAG